MNMEYLLESIAAKEGVSVSEVQQEMEKAIDAAYNDPRNKAVWDAKFGVGVRPTVEQFIETLAMEIMLTETGN